MYVIKRYDTEYFTGDTFSSLQSDAKRFDIVLTPTSTFSAYIKLLFGEPARLVKLRAKRDTFGPFADRFDDNEWP